LQAKSIALQEYVDENLAKGFICHFKFPTWTLILFVKKNDEYLQMWANYQRLKKVTKKNSYHLPVAFYYRTLKKFKSANFFTKINLMEAITLSRL